MSTIEGVVSVETKSLRSFKVKIDRSYANGHDFCELIVDEANNRFTAILYGGESFTYSWGSPGKSFIKFLINVFKNDDSYLYGKLSDRAKEQFVDVELTIKTMKEMLLKMRRTYDVSEEKAREAFDRLEDMFGGEDKASYDHFYSQYFDGLIDEVFGPEPFHDEFMHSTHDYDCSIFCKLVAPILGRVLEHEYKEELKELN